MSELRFPLLHDRAFWHGVRLGYSAGIWAGGVIGAMAFLLVDWRWSVVFLGIGGIGVCAWAWECLSWEHRASDE